MKTFKNFFCVALLAIIAINSTAQDNATPRDILAKCHNAGSSFNYSIIKECLSARNAAYVDQIKQKFESPDMKLQKGLISAALQTAQYDIVEEKISENGKSATLKTKVSVMGQSFTADVILIKENNVWKIDNVPNAKDIPSQIPMLQNLLKL